MDLFATVRTGVLNVVRDTRAEFRELSDEVYEDIDDPVDGVIAIVAPFLLTATLLLAFSATLKQPGLAMGLATAFMALLVLIGAFYTLASAHGAGRYHAALYLGETVPDIEEEAA